MDKFTHWKERMAALDAALQPIAKRPIDITGPDWALRLRSFPNPLEEAGVRAAAEEFLSEVIDVYPFSDDETRQSIRELFAGHGSFTWAAALPHPPITDESFRAHLILFSIRDQGRDTRDAILELQSLCDTAGSAGVNIGPILKQAAELSSDVDRFGMGSTRSLLLHEQDRLGK